MIQPAGNEAGGGGGGDPDGSGFDAMEIVKKVDEVLPTAVKVAEAV